MLKKINSVNLHNKRKGFTLLELTFSLAFYTFIVLTAVTSFIGIFGIYNRSQGLTRTQMQARVALDSLVRDLRNTEKLTSFATKDAVGYPVPNSDPQYLNLSNVYCLESSDGFTKGYAALWLGTPGGDNRYHLIRMQNCKTTVGYEMLIGPDTWLDVPPPPGTAHNAQGQLDNSSVANQPLIISELNAGSKPKVWSVTVAAHKGSRIKSIVGSGLTDQFSAETTLQTVVTTRK